LGINCFWILSSKIKNKNDIEKWQKTIIPLQIKALEVSKLYNYIVPEKIQDKKIRKMAENNITFAKLIEKHGFDPRDESWIEKNLPNNERERNWFMFERNIKIPIKWSNIKDLTSVFNDKFNDNASTDELYQLSTKRARYLLGSYITRMSWNNDEEKWEQEAIEFEKKHRKIEGRQWKWAINQKGKFPIVTTKKPIEFRCEGTLFNIFLEKFPYLFTTPECTELKENIKLRVVAYDKESHYIRLDFTEDVRKIIKGGFLEEDDQPWLEDQYVILLSPENIQNSLDQSEF